MFTIEILDFINKINIKILVNKKSEIKPMIKKEFPGVKRIILKETYNGYYATEGHGDTLATIIKS
jgi:hypothetical protein